jgi:hypothetical protein
VQGPPLACMAWRSLMTQGHNGCAPKGQLVRHFAAQQAQGSPCSIRSTTHHVVDCSSCNMAHSDSRKRVPHPFALLKSSVRWLRSDERLRARICPAPACPAPGCCDARNSGAAGSVVVTSGVTAGSGDMPASAVVRHLIDASRSSTALMSGVKSCGMVERSLGDSSGLPSARGAAPALFSGVLKSDTRLCAARHALRTQVGTHIGHATACSTRPVPSHEIR